MMKPPEVFQHVQRFMKEPWNVRDNYLSDQWLPILTNMAYQCWLIYKLPVGTHITKVPGGWIFEAKFVKGAPSVRKSSRYFREAATKMLDDIGLLDEDVEILNDPGFNPGHLAGGSVEQREMDHALEKLV